MTTRVMVTLHDEVYRRVEHLAALTHREVADLLEEVLDLTELQMAPEQDRRLSALLQTQQERALSTAEQGEFVTLMQVYQEGLLRKAQALHEAVRRGLRTPLEP